MFRILVAIQALMSIAAQASVTPNPPPPMEIAPYVRDGHFSPADYKWFHGAFNDASAEEVAAYKSITAWRQTCRADGLKQTRAELAAMDVVADSSLDSMPYRSLICDQVSTVPEPVDYGNWAAFIRDVGVVRPIVEGYLTAVKLSEKAGYMDDDDIRYAATSRVIAEQTLREGLVWATDRSDRIGTHGALTPQQDGILSAELAIALSERDHDNTAWLKRVVLRHGWPKRSQVGDKVAKMAWLLVQHADADPAFQIQALRSMEPLVASGEANKNDYAFLFDRVMLKVNGKQRYATQLTCDGGKLTPLPLADETSVDSQRRKMGLGSLADYEARTLKEAGPC